LESDSRSGDGDDNLDTHASITLDGEQLGHDASDLDMLPEPFGSAEKLKNDDNYDGGNNIANNKSPRPAKRQKSASRCCAPNLHHTSTTPIPHNEDVVRRTENADASNSDEPGDDDFLPKRRKLSDGRSQYSPPSDSEDPDDDGADGSESTSVDDNLASTARTAPDVFESASLAKPQLCPEVAGTNRDWEVRKIIGKEYVDGVLHW
jgi:hypothetical protein